MSITKFQEIEAWKKARELARLIYAITNQSVFSKDYALKDQMRRAVVSIMSNIAEGFERGGTIEFRRFLNIAKGSTGEIQSQSYITLDADFIDQKQFDSIFQMSMDVGNLIGRFIKYLNRYVTEKKENSQLKTRNA